MKNNDETENLNILKALTNEASEPRAEFREELKIKTIRELKESKNFIPFGFSDKALNYLSVFVVTVSVISVSIAGLLLRNKSLEETVSPNIAAQVNDKKSEVIAAIIKNNPDTVVAKNITSLSAASDSEDLLDVAKTTADISAASETKDFNYSYNRILYTYGKQVNSCELNINKNIASQSIFTYRDKSGENLFRFVNKDLSSQQINSIQVQTSGNDIINSYMLSSNEVIQFRTKADSAPISSPSSFPQDANENLLNGIWDSTNTSLNEIISNGTKFYTLDTVKSVKCSDENNKLITRQWINSDNYTITKTETFLNTDDESNLIIRADSSIIKQNLDSSKALKDFVLSPDPSRVIDITGLNEFEILNKLRDIKLETILTNGNPATNVKISKLVDLVSNDVKFYDNEASFEAKMHTSVSSLVTYSFDEFNVSIYDPIAVDSSIFDSNSLSSEDQKILIGDNIVDSTIYLPTTPTSAPTQDASMQYLTFEYKSYKYLISSNNLDSIINSGLLETKLSNL